MKHSKRLWRLITVLVVLSVILLAACQPATPQPAEKPAAENKLEIFSWWTAGGEADGLNALFDIYKKKYPDVEIINATVAGGAGTNAKAVLKTRMQGGDPPDSFQVHGGAELIDTWVKPGFMEPVTFIYKEEGWMDKFPKDLIDIVSYDGEIWSVPVNVHRGNVLWYNKAIFDKYGLKAPETFDEFFQVAETLKQNGVTPLALGDKNKWTAAHLFEDILLGVLGPDGYRGLWDGTTDWRGAEVKQALEIMARMMDYVNEDHAAYTWDGAVQLLIDGKAAMNVMGDWAAGYFTSKGWKPNEHYGWAPSPNTRGSFMIVTDTFGLPKGAPHRENAINWLKVLGSKEGQEAFNPLKGSICARLDCDRNVFDAYLQSSMDDFASNALVPSEVHGSAAPEGFATAFNDIINVFVTDRNVGAAQEALYQACVDNGMCK